MSDVLIVGPCRPPFGGIEVYRKNLEAGLRAHGLSVETIDVVPRSRDGTPRLRFYHKLLRFFRTIPPMLRSDAPVVHVLSSSYASLYANLVRAWIARWACKRVVFSLLGGMADQVVELAPGRRRILAFLFQQVNVVICCNSKIHRAMIALMRSAVQCEMISNALPLEVGASGKMPAVVDQFINSHPSFLLCIGGPSYEYGLHTLVTALATVRVHVPGTAACILTRLPMEGAYRDHLRQLAKSLDVEEAVLFVENVEDVIPLMLRCGAFVRPTLTDGDSMSVREALLAGRPVVASDAAPRPKGCVLFRAGDHNEMASQLIHVLAGDPRDSSDPFELQREGYQNLERIMDLYHALRFGQQGE